MLLKPKEVLCVLPASTNKTWWSGFAESRFASTQPAVPAPTIMKSKFNCTFKFSLLSLTYSKVFLLEKDPFYSIKEMLNSYGLI